MRGHRSYGRVDDAPEVAAKLDWGQGVNTVLPADRLPPMQFTHGLNLELREGFPVTRAGVGRANWLYHRGVKLGTVFQGAGLMQGADPDPATRLPSANLVVVDNNLWVCCPNTEPILLMARVTDALQRVEIIDAFDEQLILRGLGQTPLRYRYEAGHLPRELPPPRPGQLALPNAETGCYAANRVWLKLGKSEVVASDIFEWDYNSVEARWQVDDGENDEIARLKPAGENRIVALKTRGVHVINGVSDLDTVSVPPIQVDIYRVAAARGCVAPRAVEQRGQTLYYLSRDGLEALVLSDAGVTAMSDKPLSLAASRYWDLVRWLAVQGSQMAIANQYLMISVPTRYREDDSIPSSLLGGVFASAAVAAAVGDQAIVTPQGYYFESWLGTATKCGTIEFIASDRYRVYRNERIIELIDETWYHTAPISPPGGIPPAASRVTRRITDFFGTCSRSAGACALSGGYTWRRYNPEAHRPNYNAGLSYAALAEIYFATGDAHYRALSAIAPGETPLSAPAKWFLLSGVGGYLDNLVKDWGRERPGQWNKPELKTWGGLGQTQQAVNHSGAIGCAQDPQSGLLYNVRNNAALRNLYTVNGATLGYASEGVGQGNILYGQVHSLAFGKWFLEDEDTWTDALIRVGAAMTTGRNYTEITSWTGGINQFTAAVASRLVLPTYPNVVGERYRLELNLYDRPLPLDGTYTERSEHFLHDGGRTGPMIIEIPARLGFRVVLVSWQFFRVREALEDWHLWRDAEYANRFLVGEYQAPFGSRWAEPGAWEVPPGSATHLNVDSFKGLPNGQVATVGTGLYWGDLGIYESPMSIEAVDGFTGVPNGPVIAPIQSGWGWAAPGFYVDADSRHNIDTFTGVPDGAVATITSGDGSWETDFPGRYEFADKNCAIDGFNGIANGPIFTVTSSSALWPAWADNGIYEQR